MELTTEFHVIHFCRLLNLLWQMFYNSKHFILYTHLVQYRSVQQPKRKAIGITIFTQNRESMRGNAQTECMIITFTIDLMCFMWPSCVLHDGFVTDTHSRGRF